MVSPVPGREGEEGGYGGMVRVRGPPHTRVNTRMKKHPPFGAKKEAAFATMKEKPIFQKGRRERMAKSKYETHVLPNLDKIIKWAKDGATAKEIAANLHIAYSTFRKYLDEGQEGDERYAALSAAFAQACEVPDEQVENALFKSCLGYNAQIVKHYKLKTVEYDPETGKRIREVETLVEARDEVHVAANTAAQMFWLTNRKPETWKYKPETQDGDEDEGSGVVLLSPVMDNPGPPTEGGANDG